MGHIFGRFVVHTSGDNVKRLYMYVTIHFSHFYHTDLQVPRTLKLYITAYGITT